MGAEITHLHALFCKLGKPQPFCSGLLQLWRSKAQIALVQRREAHISFQEQLKTLCLPRDKQRGGPKGSPPQEGGSRQLLVEETLICLFVVQRVKLKAKLSLSFFFFLINRRKNKWAPKTVTAIIIKKKRFMGRNCSLEKVSFLP